MGLTGDRLLRAERLSLAKGDDDVVICKSPSATKPPESFVQHYYTSGKFAPSLMDPGNPQVGLLQPVSKVTKGYLACTFDRVKELTADGAPKSYRNLFKSNAYILAAMGQLDQNGGWFTESGN